MVELLDKACNKWLLINYCHSLHPHTYRLMLISRNTFQVNFIVILTGNYTDLVNKLSKPHVPPPSSHAYSVAPPSTMATSLPPQSIPGSSHTGATPYIRGTRDQSYPDSDYKGRRSSKDIELDYLIDDESSVTVPPRRRDLDSNVGVNYYYRDRPQYWVDQFVCAERITNYE